MQDRLKLAGLLAIVNALLIYPLSDMAMSLSGRSSFSAMLLFGMVSAIGFFLFVYVFSTLKILLNQRFDYHGADLALIALISLNAANIVVNLLLAFLGMAHELLEAISFVLVIGTGVAFVFVGWKLRSVPQYLYDFGRALPYTLIPMGIAIASVVLIKYGVLIGVVMYLILGIVLSKAAREYEEQKL
ncbi:MAG: hypothetical protein ABFS02_07570 [Pseudomonadota bacterium]